MNNRDAWELHKAAKAAKAALEAFEGIKVAFADLSPAEHLIRKGPVTVSIPYGTLTSSALRDLKEQVEMLPEDEGTKELRTRFDYLLKKAEERARWEGEEGCEPCEPEPAAWWEPGHPSYDGPDKEAHREAILKRERKVRKRI